MLNTPYESIPDFGQNPTIYSITNGDWSNPNIWNLQRLPTAGDVVVISSNTEVVYDVVSDTEIGVVSVDSGALFRFSTIVSTKLMVQTLLVKYGGWLQVGTEKNPILDPIKAEIIFLNKPIDTTFDPYQYGNGLVVLGKINVHGSQLEKTFIRLSKEPVVGDAFLYLNSSANGWRVGDRIVLPDTRHLVVNERRNNYVPQWEIFTIQSVSSDGLTIGLNTNVKFNHIGARNANGQLEFLPHVVNLTRSVAFKSQSQSGVRAHSFFTYRADVDIRYASFGGMGRTKETPIDNTTQNASGVITHIGTNQKGRYPIHFHHLIGPTNTPNNGYQFTFIGNSVFCMMSSVPFIWGLTVHDSHYGIIKQNVLYNWSGAGIVTEDGNESYNLFEENFVLAIRGKNNPRDNNALEGACFWFHGFNNYIGGNVACNGQNTFSQIVSGVGFKFFLKAARNVGMRNIPLFKGADLTVAGEYKTVQMQDIAILDFSNNEAYGAMSAGATIWNLGTDGYGLGSISTTIIKNFLVWHCWEEGFYAYPIKNVVFDGLIVRGHPRAMNNNDGGTGWRSGDYWSENVIIRNSNIQGMHLGISNFTNTPVLFVIENSYLCNYLENIKVNTLATPGTGALKPARKIEIRNVRYNKWQSSPSYITLSMRYGAGNKSDVVQKDQVFVYDYNGIPGDNFKLYYSEQIGSFIVPKTGSVVGLIGSPESGLTNDQNWAKYGLAIAGAVAPNGVTNRPEIVGLIEQLQ